VDELMEMRDLGLHDADAGGWLAGAKESVEAWKISFSLIGHYSPGPWKYKSLGTKEIKPNTCNAHHPSRTVLSDQYMNLATFFPFHSKPFNEAIRHKLIGIHLALGEISTTFFCSPGSSYVGEGARLITDWAYPD
jgi:hypothetical protein